MLYGTEEWDPKAIIFQILEFQAYHYVVLGATVLAVLGTSLQVVVLQGSCDGRALLILLTCGFRWQDHTSRTLASICSLTGGVSR